LLNNPISSWFVERVKDYAYSIQQSNPQMAQQYQVLANYSAEMFTNDLILASLFISLCLWSIYLYLNKKFSADILIAIFILMTIMDLWRIDSRGAKYIDNPDIESLFTKPDYISFIEQQNENEPFRILNLKQDGSIGSISNNANFHARFLIEDFYGYSGIKPRAYQDYIDIVGPVNQTLWNMLNVKYIITDQPVTLPGLKPVYNSNKTHVFLNENHLPRMFFVDKIEKMSPLDFIYKIKSEEINPKNMAIVENGDLEVEPVDSSATIKITKYDESIIEADVIASGNNFIFVGTTYMPGWKALIDGKDTKVFKANHGYMGIVIPKGNHKLSIEYAPESFFLSRSISLALSSIVIIGLILSLFFERRRKNAN
jgi:hypothetical protein